MTKAWKGRKRIRKRTLLFLLITDTMRDASVCVMSFSHSLFKHRRLNKTKCVMYKRSRIRKDGGDDDGKRKTTSVVMYKAWC